MREYEIGEEIPQRGNGQSDAMRRIKLLQRVATGEGIDIAWEPLETWAHRHEAEVVNPDIECAGCRKLAPFTEAQTTVVRGAHGDELPVRGFIHCGACVLKMDARNAWLIASGNFRPQADPEGLVH